MDPSLEEILRIARSLGFDLTYEEIPIYRDFVRAELRRLEAFLHDDTPEAAPPRYPGSRNPGSKPMPGSDPFNAWLWRCRIEGDSVGILQGKTVSFKDNIAVAGIPLTFGTSELSGLIPDFDATVVVRTLESGGTIIGKNTMSGFTGAPGSGSPFGDSPRPLNPHNFNNLPGGSSSGSAIAVAVGEVDISFGDDQGGSVRLPASWCGVIGLKPTFGLISHFGASWDRDQTMDHVGPLARYTADAAAALQAVAGYDYLDPRQDRTIPTRINVLSTLEDGIEGLRLGVLEEGFVGAEADVSQAVDTAVDTLAEAGALVKRVSVPEHHLIEDARSALETEASLAVFSTNIAGVHAKTWYPRDVIAAVNEFWLESSDRLRPQIKARLLVAALTRRAFYGRVYAKAQNTRAQLVACYDRAFAEVDLLVMPTCIRKPPEVTRRGTHLKNLEKELTQRATAVTRNTSAFNYTGHPAVTIPCGRSSGLPIGLQLVGRHNEDPLLLRAAYAYEKSIEWDELIKVGSN